SVSKQKKQRNFYNQYSKMLLSQLLFLTTLAILSPITKSAKSSINCKPASQAFASLGILDSVKGGPSGPICSGECCASQLEASLIKVARKQLADLLRNHLTVINSNTCSNNRIKRYYRQLDYVRQELPISAAAAAPSDCLTVHLKSSGFCSLCRGEAGTETVVNAGWNSTNLKLCLKPLFELSKVWDRVIDKANSIRYNACLSSFRGLLNWQSLFDKCNAVPCLAPPSVSYYLSRPLPISSLLSTLNELTLSRRRRLRRQYFDLTSSGSAPPPPPPKLPTILSSGDGAPPTLITNGSLNNYNKIIEQTSGDSKPTLIPPPFRPSSLTPVNPGNDVEPSGDLEPPPPPRRERPPQPGGNQIIDMYPPLPDPRAPPPPDLWLPKTYPDGEPDSGGAVRNRGEGSVHGPQMVAMRGQQRECLYSDTSRCHSASARLAFNPISVLICAALGYAAIRLRIAR
ncbi:hypothetical protein BOX15_Mlig022675g1, partial [Macrostomum lignano]